MTGDARIGRYGGPCLVAAHSVTSPAMPAQVWIAQVEFDPEVATKLQTKHNVSPDEVREATCFGAHRKAFWDMHPQYGRRLIVIGDSYAGVPIVAYLRPIDEADGIWECRTAYIWED